MRSFQVFLRMWRNWNVYILLVQIYIGKTPLETIRICQYLLKLNICIIYDLAFLSQDPTKVIHMFIRRSILKRP